MHCPIYTFSPQFSLYSTLWSNNFLCTFCDLPKIRNFLDPKIRAGIFFGPNVWGLFFGGSAPSVEFLIFRIHQFHVRIFDTNILVKRLITFHANSPSTVLFTVVFTRDIFGYTNHLGNSWFFGPTNYFRNLSLELQMFRKYQLLFEFFGKFRSPPTSSGMIGDLFISRIRYFLYHQLFRWLLFLGTPTLLGIFWGEGVLIPQPRWGLFILGPPTLGFFLGTLTPWGLLFFWCTNYLNFFFFVTCSFRDFFEIR